MVLMSSPLGTFHTKILFSTDPHAKYSPSGENATNKHQLECASVFMSYPVDTLQTTTVLSLDVEAKYSPSGENT